MKKIVIAEQNKVFWGSYSPPPPQNALVVVTFTRTAAHNFTKVSFSALIVVDEAIR